MLLAALSTLGFACDETPATAPTASTLRVVGPDFVPVAAGATPDVALRVFDDDADVTASATLDLVVPPMHGTLSAFVDGATARYTPTSGFDGLDTAVVVGRTATRVSAPFTLVFAVAKAEVPAPAAHVAPTATAPLVVDVASGGTAALTLSGSSPYVDESALVVHVLTPPAHGMLDVTTGAAPLVVTYTPSPGFVGTDVLRFAVEDPTGAVSPTETVAMSVAAAAPADGVSIASFAPSRTLIGVGESVTLAWVAQADHCAIDGVLDDGPASGAVTVQPLATASYRLACRDAFGHSHDRWTSVVVSLDTDGDGILDVLEALHGTSLLDRDMDDDGRFDGTEDADRDGLVDPGETSPFVPDTDADGVCDGVRVDGEGNGLDVPSACTGFEGPVFVRAEAAPGGACMNWSNACATIPQAMGVAIAGTELWIAEGTYRASASKAPVLTMKSGVSVYGGFAGTETSRAARSRPLRSTILTGDFAANDPVVNDNSMHVVYGSTVANAVLDGVIVVAGKGGALNSGDDPLGAGISLVTPTNVVLSRVRVEGNVGTLQGGGIYCGGSGTLVIRDSIVRANSVTSDTGGGLYNNCVTSVYGVTFTGNVAASGGGGIYDAGTLSVTNSLFTDNSATIGGALFVAGPTRLVNCTLYANHASNSGGAIRGSGGTLTSINNVFWGNTAPLLVPDWNGSTPVTESYTFASQPVSGTGSVQLTADPYVRLASGELVLVHTPASPPVDGGSDAAADDGSFGYPFFGVDVHALSTRDDGALDATPVDAGYHYDPTAPVVVSFAATATTFTWNVRNATRCSLAVGGASPLVLDADAIATGTMPNAAPSGTSAVLTCEGDATFAARATTTVP